MSTVLAGAIVCFIFSTDFPSWGVRGNLPGVSHFPAQKVRCEEITAEGKKVFFQVDGELIGRLPCTVEIVPDALTLLVPSPHERDP